MFKKISVLSLLSIFLLTAGFGCKSVSQTEQASIKAVKLTYWTVYNDVDELRVLAQQYTQRYPHVSINSSKLFSSNHHGVCEGQECHDRVREIQSVKKER